MVVFPSLSSDHYNPEQRETRQLTTVVPVDSGLSCIYFLRATQQPGSSGFQNRSWGSL